MSAVPSEELAERRAQSARYHASRRIIEIDEKVRGIRVVVNILIREEKALLAEKEALQPSRDNK